MKKVKTVAKMILKAVGIIIAVAMVDVTMMILVFEAYSPHVYGMGEAFTNVLKLILGR